MITELTNEQLDRWAAEVLMGCRVNYTDRLFFYDPVLHEWYFQEQPYHPSTDITQALGDGGPGTVVGRMRELGWEYTVKSWGKVHLVVFGKGRFRDKQAGIAESATPSTAFLRAAYAAYTATGGE
jgi:hypothetical protein